MLRRLFFVAGLQGFLTMGNLFAPYMAAAADLKPWFPRNLEFQSRFTYLHQQYCKVNTGSHATYKRSKDDFYIGSLELAYDDYCGEVEVVFAATGQRHLGPDNINATLRYQILDDVVGDDVSLVAGITLGPVFTAGLKDISVFHHGHFEGEVTLALGKECPCSATWSSRTWAVVGIGTATDQGYPWFHGEAAWEKNWWDRQRFRVFADVIVGFGNESLDLSCPFDGYGPIRHRSVDIGGLYRYTFECAGSLSLGYARRVFAKNCPKDVNIFFVTYLYPFGL